MKNTFLIFVILFSFSALAEIEEKCIRESDDYGGMSTFSPDCEDWIFKNSKIKKSTKTYYLHIWEQVMILKSKNGMFIYAGPNTKIKDVLDATYDEKNNRIALLNESKDGKEILIFDGKMKGDVAPAKILSSSDFEKTISLKFSEENDVLITKNEKEEVKWDISKDSRVVGAVKPIPAKEEDVPAPEKEEKSFSLLSIFGLD